MPQSESRIRSRQAFCAGLLAIWRISALPATMIWRDWLMVVAAYWLAVSVTSRPASRATLTVTAMAYLMGIYVAGQAPHTLASLGFR